MGIVSSLYLHVPFCRHLCNYCDFYKQKLTAPVENWRQYEEYLSASLKRHESIMVEQNMRWGDLETLYLGGGTPSLWGKRGAEWLQQDLNLILAKNAEVTLEIDPGMWQPEELIAWEKFGVNRYSVGTQSLDERFLKVLDRAHGREETFGLLTALKGKNFSVDFLLGAPRSSEWKRNILQELEELLSYGPSHVSLYILNPSGGYKLKAFIPDDEWVGEEYLSVSEYLRKNGFNHYEVSNFAKTGLEARHNLRYWMGENVAALGPTGTGYFAHSPTQAWRYKWKPSQTEVECEMLGAAELSLEKLYLRLRLNLPFELEELFLGHETAAQAMLSRWSDRGLCSPEGAAWRMQPAGWVILDSLMDEVFATLPSM